MWDRAAKEVTKHNAHDQQRHQRVQNTPDRAEKAALIFSIEIPSDQLFKQEAVFIQCLQHKFFPFLFYIPNS